MKTFEVDNYRGIALRQSMAALIADPKALPAGFHSATTHPEVGMLIEPINSAPFVFTPPLTVIEFDYEKGSGTDHLRQRMLASVFFRQLVENHQNSARAPAASPVTTASRMHP